MVDRCRSKEDIRVRLSWLQLLLRGRFDRHRGGTRRIFQRGISQIQDQRGSRRVDLRREGVQSMSLDGLRPFALYVIHWKLEPVDVLRGDWCAIIGGDKEHGQNLRMMACLADSVARRHHRIGAGLFRGGWCSQCGDNQTLIKHTGREHCRQPPQFDFTNQPNDLKGRWNGVIPCGLIASDTKPCELVIRSFCQ